MKLIRFLLAAIAVAIFAVPSSQLSADIVFANEDGIFDSGPNPGGAEDRMNADLVGVVGSSGTFVDNDTMLSVLLTTVDIIGVDGTLASTGVVTFDEDGNPDGESNFHETNILNNGDFAVNTDTDQDDSGAPQDAGHFNVGEGWIFSFDVDVELQSITFGDFEAGVNPQLVIGDGTPIDLSSDASGDGTIVDFADTIVTGGTEILLTFASTDGPGDQFSVRSIQLDVVAAQVPEPSSLALLGLLGGVAAIRRRR